jgi:hypothetical protein
MHWHEFQYRGRLVYKFKMTTRKPRNDAQITFGRGRPLFVETRSAAPAAPLGRKNSTVVSARVATATAEDLNRTAVTLGVSTSELVRLLLTTGGPAHLVARAKTWSSDTHAPGVIPKAPVAAPSAPRGPVMVTDPRTGMQVTEASFVASLNPREKATYQQQVDARRTRAAEQKSIAATVKATNAKNKRNGHGGY